MEELNNRKISSLVAMMPIVIKDSMIIDLPSMKWKDTVHTLKLIITRALRLSDSLRT